MQTMIIIVTTIKNRVQQTKNKELIEMHVIYWIRWWKNVLNGIGLSTIQNTQCVFILNNYIPVIIGCVHVWSILMWSFRANKILWDSNLFVDLNSVRLLFSLQSVRSVCVYYVIWPLFLCFIKHSLIFYSFDFIQYFIQSLVIFSLDLSNWLFVFHILHEKLLSERSDKKMQIEDGERSVKHMLESCLTTDENNECVVQTKTPSTEWVLALSTLSERHFSVCIVQCHKKDKKQSLTNRKRHNKNTNIYLKLCCRPFFC